MSSSEVIAGPCFFMTRRIIPPTWSGSGHARQAKPSAGLIAARACSMLITKCVRFRFS